MMNIEEKFQQLRENRFMRNREEVENFEEVLQSILEENDKKLIKGLCSAFDDESDQHDVMFGLIHAVEWRYDKEGLCEFIQVIPSMLPHAKEWASLLLFRILNAKNFRENFTRILIKLRPEVRNEIVDLLKEIKEEDPKQFEKSVDEVLSKINN